jgi:hypothetical protein
LPDRLVEQPAVGGLAQGGLRQRPDDGHPTPL